MNILLTTFAAFYVSALAFVAGQITAHVVVARQPGNLQPSNASLVVALIQFAVLVSVGLILGIRRRRVGARAADTLPPEHAHQRRADVVAKAVDVAETRAVVPAIRAVDDSTELEVVESAREPVVADVLERAVASEVGEVHDPFAEPPVGTALESQAASTVDAGVGQVAQQHAGEVREPSADRGVIDVADCLAERTAPLAVPPAITSVTTEHVADLVEPGVVDSRARAVEGPRETPRVDATNRAMDRPARARRVQPPSIPGPAPFLPAPRIITGKSREAVARVWAGGGALILVGGVAYALGGRVPFGRPIAALLGLLGLALVTRAVAVTAARWRVGNTWVQLRNSPIAPGAELEGLVWSSNRRLRHAVRFRTPMRPARVRLLCVRGPAPTRRGTSITNSALVWQKEVAVAPGRMTVSTGHLGVPFRFDIPADVPERSRPGDAHPIVWLLSVEMGTSGIALAEQFALPIYQREPIVPRSAA